MSVLAGFFKIRLKINSFIYCVKRQVFITLHH
jgi:hypothetical protein